MAQCSSCSSCCAPTSFPSPSKTVPGEVVFGEGHCASVSPWVKGSILGDGHKSLGVCGLHGLACESCLAVAGWGEGGQDLCWEMGGLCFLPPTGLSQNFSASTLWIFVVDNSVCVCACMGPCMREGGLSCTDTVGCLAASLAYTYLMPASLLFVTTKNVSRHCQLFHRSRIG